MQEAIKSPPTLAELREKRDEILRLAEKRGAFNLRVFGSVARGDARPDSDVDIMAEFKEEATIFDVAGLWGELEELLGCKVDLVLSEGLKEYVRPSALRDAIDL